MSRPPTPRKVHRALRERRFEPVGRGAGLEPLRLSLDGLEALRLADLEGLYQEEAAQRMGVSRATFARVLTAARGAVAEALVQGKAVQIGGGEIETSPVDRWPCPVHDGGRRRGRECRCGRHETPFDGIRG